MEESLFEKRERAKAFVFRSSFLFLSLSLFCRRFSPSFSSSRSRNGHGRLAPRRRGSSGRFPGREGRSSERRRRCFCSRRSRRQGSNADAHKGGTLRRGPRLCRGCRSRRLRVRPRELWQHLLLQQRLAGELMMEREKREGRKMATTRSDNFFLSQRPFNLSLPASLSPQALYYCRPFRDRLLEHHAATRGSTAGDDSLLDALETCSRRRTRRRRPPLRGRARPPPPPPRLRRLPSLLPPAGRERLRQTPSPPPPAASSRACWRVPRAARAR